MSSTAACLAGPKIERPLRSPSFVIVPPLPTATARSIARLGLFALHIVCAAYFVVAAMVYRYLPASTLAILLDVYSLSLETVHFDAICVAHLAFATLHGYAAASIAAAPWVRRGLGRLASVQCHQRSHLMMPGSSTSISEILHIEPQTRAHRMWLSARQHYAAAFGRRGLFGVDSVHFDAIFTCRKAIGTTLQSLQAYRMSRLLWHERLNEVYVALVVLNCWSTPLLRRVVRRNLRRQRLLCLVFDILLDFVSTIGVPVALAVRYSNDFDQQASNFTTRCWYDDIWFAMFLSDTPVMLLASWVDAASRTIFSLSMLASLSDVGAIINSPRTSLSQKSSRVTPGNAIVFSDHRHSCVTRCIHSVMAVFGFVVLGAHIHAVTKPSAQFCLREIRPWFVRKPACALAEMNCRTSPWMVGTSLDFDAVIGNLDIRTLEQITIRHCPALTIPPRVRELHSLVGLKVFNSSIVQWESDAALTNDVHSRMRFLFLVCTHLPNGSLPPGLLAPDFPSSLSDIEIIQTNLHHLPDNLYTRWPQGLSLFLEFNPFHSFPRVLERMNVTVLSLIGCGLETMPPEALQMPTVVILALSLNPLTSLPETGMDAAIVSFQWLFLDWTNITNLPTWMMNTAFLEQKALFLSHSPHCENESLVEHDPRMERLDVIAPRSSVSLSARCRDAFVDTDGLYPLHFEKNR